MYIVDALEAGVTAPAADLIHAVQRTLRGREALCGAGPIIGGVLGRFADVDADSAHVCLACFAVALPAPRRAS